MELSPIQQLDIVLTTLKSDRGHISFDDLYNRVKHKGIDGDVLLRILEKLKRDDFIYIKQVLTAGEAYAITVEGFMFKSYEKKIKNEKSLACRKNIRDFVLSWGTLLAGIVATILLIWQIYTYYNPQLNPCELTSKQKIEQK
jgi:hypothetical protein